MARLRCRRLVWSRRAAMFMTLLATLVPETVLAAPFGYVVNHGDGTVSVLDTATNTVVATVTVGTQPFGAAVTPNGSRVYVTDRVTAGTVAVIDSATNGVIATVPVGALPSGVAVKLPGNRAYVTNRDDKNVAVLDTATNAVLATIPVGNSPLGIAVDPAGSPAYVANNGSQNVSVIDTARNEVVATITVGSDPSNVAVSPNGRRVYVTNGGNASVSVIDTGTNSVIATVPVGNIPEGVAVEPSGDRVYVANSGPDSVSVIDVATNTVTATVEVGTTPSELAFRPDGARLFVANQQGSSVSVIDTATNAVTATVTVGQSPMGRGQFVVPALRLPLFGKDALKCQKAVGQQGIKLAKLQHALEMACRLGVIKAENAGKGTAKAEAACAKALDLGNPTSKLAVAQARLVAAVTRSCAKAGSPRAINAPCSRGAATIGATATCIRDQHDARVDALVGDEFSATRPSPLGKVVTACQTAIAKNGRRFADRLHKELGACLQKLLAAAAKGKGEPKAIGACLAKLDLGNVLAKASQARAAAAAAIAKKCAGVTPVDLGNPCDAGAATVTVTASCVLDHHVSDVARMIAAEFNDACVMLTRSGLGLAYPTACLGPS